MIFEGTRGTSLYGDIGLDDIKLLPSTQGKCPKSTDCTFEYGMCAWSNTLIGDIFDWSMRKGNTPSTGTGPSADHTLNSASGNAIPEKNYHMLTWVHSLVLTLDCKYSLLKPCSFWSVDVYAILQKSNSYTFTAVNIRAMKSEPRISLV